MLLADEIFGILMDRGQLMLLLGGNCGISMPRYQVVI